MRKTEKEKGDATPRSLKDALGAGYHYDYEDFLSIMDCEVKFTGGAGGFQDIEITFPLTKRVNGDDELLGVTGRGRLRFGRPFVPADKHELQPK